MQALYNHSGELIAYHYQNMLIHPEDLDVMGLILGNCVFDREAQVIGKLFQQKVYNISGEILASQSDETIPLPTDLDMRECIMDGWKVLVSIKDHSCPWVEPTQHWSTASLAESLYA